MSRDRFAMSAPTLDLRSITSRDLTYPAPLKICRAFKSAPILNAIGDVNLLQNPEIALFCSKQCPGDLILKTYDLAQSLRDQAIPVISGFHTPIEQDCLKIMLRSIQPIIHCPARSISKIRLSPEQKQAIGENRLLLISPFSASYPRVTAELAGKRNEMIGAIAQTIFIAYAAPNSKTLAFAQRLISAGKSVVTFASPSNPLLQEQGIVGLGIDAIVQHCLGTHIKSV
jgi:predicted Rossmann fold nucleotide-binding protein DprA/Smf involved in DNA uptake